MAAVRNIAPVDTILEPAYGGFGAAHPTALAPGTGRPLGSGLTVLVLAFGTLAGTAPARADTIGPGDPISHVVIIYQENHSFDNVLGAWCVADRSLQRRDHGQVFNGTTTKTVPLPAATDVVPPVDHTDTGQIRAMDGGKMDKWQTLSGCAAPTTGACSSSSRLRSRT